MKELGWAERQLNTFRRPTASIFRSSTFLQEQHNPAMVDLTCLLVTALRTNWAS